MAQMANSPAYEPRADARDVSRSSHATRSSMSMGTHGFPRLPRTLRARPGHDFEWSGHSTGKGMVPARENELVLCPRCRTCYRYQDRRSGFFFFNCRIHFCLLLLAGEILLSCTFFFYLRLLYLYSALHTPDRPPQQTPSPVYRSVNATQLKTRRHGRNLRSHQIRGEADFQYWTPQKTINVYNHIYPESNTI